MNTFDPYTRNIISTFLTEGSGSAMGMQINKKTKSQYKTDSAPDGYDPYQQMTWWNYSQKVEKALEGITAGGFGGVARGAGEVAGKAGDFFGGQMVGNAFRAVGSALGSGIETLGPVAEYGIKQALRTALAKTYLGASIDPIKTFEEELKPYNLDEKIPAGLKEFYAQIKATAAKAIDPKNVPDLAGLIASNRMGPMGQYAATRMSKLAMAGENPLTLALKGFGAESATNTIRQSYTTAPDFAETAGGFLQKGKQLGIYK